ncbi:protein adenylyltransferase Fic [Neocloeon triangulifer]|uniref:protein adenylyltransferase Fic n=1 Tax=Neocloeon triangulifer TaxID=2078957 RepID=UPI00286F4D97|nr:protein adenylyltransferase Fic [Neocloeon triangulifer]XP_059485971.1 protein adenylyltransferase Fic [Neocloeon triangulifer]XP_059485972.1 protein adenylyltransferase Fic [Neocloeon triangulifer]XP_059485974.1 protein adenylyltransferase Fic [Neocloeon triangulifer]XP_059485975.1 protein adenylyltransferase Fic [Neocloeon triangulifer]XP_059485976.1 protein adenylyltransferase Fic [Neocloeon triangulifer]XP_059485977.1 protein adenylyltransferase Fic [Neocloeon triangulifer]
MNKFIYALIFLSGAIFALLATYLNEVLKPKQRTSIQVFRSEVLEQYKDTFFPLPPGSSYELEEDSTLGTVIQNLQKARRTTKPPDKAANKANDQEALASLHAALEKTGLKQFDKALKLFQHAIALAPSNPDVLNHFGEFLEHTHKDVLEADTLYARALSHHPSHQEAKVNHQRTLPVVEALDAENLKRIDQKRLTLAQISTTDAALRRAKREAYFQHVFHTVGLEGNTMSLAQTRVVLETRMAVHGKSLVEHGEILGLDAALKFLNNTLLRGKSPGHLDVEDILAIHKRVMAYVEPFDAGTFRHTQVFVGNHIPPPPSEVNHQVAQLVEWLRSTEALQLHPIRYAALAHYKLVYIHPFTDGNGRTSRLLMNLILMQAGYAPVIIPRQDRQKYYEYLEMANNGDIRPFVRFVADCAERTLDLYLWATSEFNAQIPALAGNQEDYKAIIVDNDNPS